MSRYKPINLDRIKTISIKKRPSKTAVKAFAGLPGTTGARDFFEALPDFLKAAEFKDFIKSIVTARNKKRPFQLMMGAHVIKVGLAPVIIDMMKRKIITGISMNSAGLIHDLEIAFTGKTSEEVQAGLEDGTFGMAAETGAMFAGVVKIAEEKQIGLGEAAGMFIENSRAKLGRYSLFAAAYKYNLPATVHLMIGTDIVQQQPSFEAGPAAEASYLDFKILAEILKTADAGGVVANIGSSVVLPEVFLKALTVARNIKKQKSRLITANFDMISHYRPVQNVVKRPTKSGGRGFNFIGHHEIMIPLLYWGLKAYLKKTKK
jgi:hypothetical protein